MKYDVKWRWNHPRYRRRRLAKERGEGKEDWRSFSSMIYCEEVCSCKSTFSIVCCFFVISSLTLFRNDFLLVLSSMFSSLLRSELDRNKFDNQLKNLFFFFLAISTSSWCMSSSKSFWEMKRKRKPFKKQDNFRVKQERTSLQSR